MATAAPVQIEPPSARCRNCGAPLLGEFCHVCGQPQRSPVRHFATLVEDMVDNLLNLDNRTWRTLVPLYLKPGHLTVEYLKGRRVRYVAPLRLYLFLSVIAFIAVAAAAEFDDRRGEIHTQVAGAPLATLDTGRLDDTPLDETGDREALAEIDRTVAEPPAQPRPIMREAARAELARRRAADEPALEAAPTPMPIGNAPPSALTDGASTTAGTQARAGAAPASAGTGSNTAPGIQAVGPDGVSLYFGDEPWDRVNNPLVFAWLPDDINAAINDAIAVMQDNARRVRDRPELIRRKALSLAPTAQLLMLPLFALLLKLAYLFRNRLYVEHLIFALHSHSFICLSLIGVSFLDWLAAHGAGYAWISAPAHALAFAAWMWMPIYLVLMLKRVYAQGWPMTLVKGLGIGCAYGLLFLFGLGATLLASLAVL